MKYKVAAIGSFFMLAASLEAVTYEYFQLYKDTKVMGAGGAGVASANSFSAIFSNPAGLARMPKEYGWEFQLINIAAVINENTKNLQDILDAADESETKAAQELDKHIGKSYHIGINAVPLSVSKMFDETGFGVGLVYSASVNAVAHQGFGASGILEINGIAVGGAALGIAHNFNDVPIGKWLLNTISVGAGAKYLQYGVISRGYSPADLAGYASEDKDVLNEDFENGNSFVLDLGVIYNLSSNFSVGTSVLNIGGIGDKGLIYIPMTVNAGGAYTYRVSERAFFNQVRVSLDLIDITQEYDDDSLIKRTRFGADLNVWDGSFSTFALQAGLYQGEFTGGFSLRLALVEIAASTYAEQIGAYNGQDEADRRYMVSVGLNW
ncbi:MAG: hypothetical protein LBT81_01255 [Helicobacteraceae bacterium]|jgi:hypothetical protein|nr:hypothetical protein [Helicobacteraceae bacterium]